MAKQTGLGDAFYVAGFDISGDVNSLSNVHGGPALQDVTDITQSANARLGLLRDGGMDAAIFFDPASGQSHAALSGMPTTDEVCAYFRGTALGNPAACCVAKQISYDWTRGADGSLSGAVSWVANGFGLEWGTQLTAGKRTDTSATAGSPVDFLAASPSFGAQAYLQVFSFSGTDVTVKIQDATTSGGAYADVTGLTFTQITGGAPLTQRIATTATQQVREFVKVTTVTTGGFTSLVFAVVVAVNPVAVAF